MDRRSAESVLDTEELKRCNIVVNSKCESNVATVSGTIISEPVFGHEVYGEGFYYFDIRVRRLSESYDIIPVTVSERLADCSEYKIGRYIEIDGQFRSYNAVQENGATKLMLTVFARDVIFYDTEVRETDINQVELNGFICKPPIYRTTPFNREITDFLLAVNRSYNKSDYIPCICWGRNARFADGFQVGDHIQLWGRIQSREYQKRIGDEEFETRIAYEISVSKLERMDSMSAVVAASEESGSDGFDTYGMDDE